MENVRIQPKHKCNGQAKISKDCKDPMKYSTIHFSLALLLKEDIICTSLNFRWSLNREARITSRDVCTMSCRASINVQAAPPGIVN